ncbi:YopX family protein [Aureibacillus halotolerans]|uniref:Putative phage protein (TIGR01671 family) n=1 Tax=Aureibacillus halotolerans TaxID=1508390 RepID=A0A4R6TZ16_9BACI|nr:YopX family protein [Aureibacillus halotolerans]TDQ39218.1 putative phage protein (TIGR01671 family) [Aureibacillus halotolerans]
MREIKFRAWDKKYNIMNPTGDHMWSDEFITCDGKVVEKTENSRGYRGTETFFEDISDQRVLMQYTGLIDKSGQEIYVGDVLEATKFWLYKINVEVCIGHYKQDGSGGEYAPTDCYGVYARAIEPDAEDEDGCRILSDYELETSILRFDEVKVIGNIYENSELVNSGKA